MPNKLVRLQADDMEIAINLERVNYVSKGQNITFIHFAGESRPLTLRAEASEAFWRCIKGSSMTIHREYPQNKNAEVLAQQDSSVLPSE